MSEEDGIEIRVAKSDDDLAACFPVMRQLRPHLTADAFLSRVRSQEAEGYRVAVLSAAGAPVAVAGYRLKEMLAYGRFIYVDDLVTDQDARSLGYGARLLAWLCERGRDAGCESLHLDSGTHRTDAHRFYDREGMSLASYHFAIPI